MNPPYCDIACADVFLADSAVWNAASTAEKDTALFWGRVYIDSSYKCVEFDETDAPEEILFANSLLAEDYIEGTLIGSSITAPIKRKKLKAGSVESETEYATASRATSPQEDVDMILFEYCRRSGGSIPLERV